MGSLKSGQAFGWIHNIHSNMHWSYNCSRFTLTYALVAAVTCKTYIDRGKTTIWKVCLVRKYNQFVIFRSFTSEWLLGWSSYWPVFILFWSVYLLHHRWHWLVDTLFFKWAILAVTCFIIIHHCSSGIRSLSLSKVAQVSWCLATSNDVKIDTLAFLLCNLDPAHGPTKGGSILFRCSDHLSWLLSTLSSSPCPRPKGEN